IAPAQGWPSGVMPTPAEGLKVKAFAKGLEHPRWLYVLPNGDVAAEQKTESNISMAFLAENGFLK
ncbi:hypothetical protein ITF28_08570, partial [Acinetobacter baumannii]|nr:hypothetical protein [Acinetobacter baumannii]